MGGTFTDVVAIDDEGRVTVAKASTTPEDQSLGVHDALQKAGIDLREVSFFSHGTTVGVNAVIENKGARLAIITTKGFRDVLELRRGQRVIDNPDDMYNLQMDLPQDYVGGYDPLVRRPFVSRCRRDWTTGATSSCRWMRRRCGGWRRRSAQQGVEAVVVCYLFPSSIPRTSSARRRSCGRCYPACPSPCPARSCRSSGSTNG